MLIKLGTSLTQYSNKVTIETVPEVKLHEDDDNYHAELDLPGVKKKDVQIEIDEGNLIINASRNDPYSNDNEELIKYKHTPSWQAGRSTLFRNT